MRNVSCDTITATVADLVQKANYFLNEDISCALKNSLLKERSTTGRDVLRNIIENADIAREKQVAICQDTGMVIVLAKIGQEVHIEGGNITDAINAGVSKGYREGYMRFSVVKDPLRRENTGDNTPAIIYYDIVPGEDIELTVLPKGFGSENMGGVKMLKPSMGEDGVKDFVIETVKNAGPNPCPPIVVGVGIGGSMDKAALLSKVALARGIDTSNPDKYYADMENELLEKINMLGIGPAGLGGVSTALGVNIESYPTHIAGLPVAVTISCHVTRHAKAKI
ncbi:MAG: fumarate hydratase [Clostridia bacterium]|nr:fumarate hydratase [Clostridia bacterium]